MELVKQCSNNKFVHIFVGWLVCQNKKCMVMLFIDSSTVLYVCICVRMPQCVFWGSSCLFFFLFFALSLAFECHCIGYSCAIFFVALCVSMCASVCLSLVCKCSFANSQFGILLLLLVVLLLSSIFCIVLQKICHRVSHIEID